MRRDLVMSSFHCIAQLSGVGMSYRSVADEILATKDASNGSSSRPDEPHAVDC